MTVDRTTTTETSTARAHDGRYFRRVLGHYPTGVAVITAVDAADRPVGMSVGTFTSVSLDPPLVAFLPDRASTTFARFRDSGSFCVNLLSHHQDDLCRTFALKDTDRFAGVSWSPAPSGAPILDGAVAWIDCDTTSVTEVGDHYIVVGAVRDLAASSPTLPLLFFRGGYGRFTPLSRVVPAESALLDEIRLVDRIRGQMERLASALDLECAAMGRVGDSIVRLASAGTPPGGGTPVRVGLRLPFEPPMGALLVAWADDDAREEWFDHASHPLGESERGRHRAALERVRQRGWLVSLRGPGFDAVDAALQRLASDDDGSDDLRALDARLDGPAAYECGELDPSATYEVRNISAPVFDAAGQAVLYVSVFGFAPTLTGRQVIDALDALSAATTEMTAALADT